MKESQLLIKVTCYNINVGYNDSLLEKSSILREYMVFVDKVREYRKDSDTTDAVSSAIDDCIKQGVLRYFLLNRRDEVQKAMVIDMTFEAREKLIKRDSFEDGYQDGYLAGAGSRQEEIDELQDVLAQKNSIIAQKESALVQMQDELEQLKLLINQKKNKSN